MNSPDDMFLLYVHTARAKKNNQSLEFQILPYHYIALRHLWLS